MTTPLGRVLNVATKIADVAPKKQGQYVYKAGIPWSLIHELRAALEGMGIDWRES